MTTENATTGGEHTALSASPEKLPSVAPPHAQKFRFALAVLCGIALGALAVAVAVAAQGSSHKATTASTRWSAWAPSSGGATGVSEIADYIAPYYRLSGSAQLDVVTPISVAQATAAGTTTGSGMTVAVSTGTSSSDASLDLLSGKTIAYNICGLGASKCELEGTPSTNRMLLMRREALELALYTFKYIGGSENVIAVLPPGHTVTASGKSASSAPVTVAVLFVRKELEPWLALPVSKTLQTYPPDLTELSAWSQTDEAALVDQITAHGLFSSQVEAQQEGGNVLVLSPLPAQ